MFSFSIFKENDFVKFKSAIKQYCAEHHYNDMNLTDDELAQLSWCFTSDSTTPEARGLDNIDTFHFEIKRGLSRRYSFELVLRGDEAAYQEFIKVQNQNTVLAFSAFKKRHEQASLLDEDTKTAVRASCFLTMSVKARSILKEYVTVLSNDSEEFLSQLAVVLVNNKSIFPITKNMTTTQLNILQKMFWPGMHLRHLLFTEGGDNMTKNFVDGIVNGTFNKQDFIAWQWRWLTNLFGFQGGPGSKYFDSVTDLLVSVVINELEKIFTDANYSYLEHYLLKRSEMAGLNREELNLTKTEQVFLGHVAAYYHQITVLTADEGDALYAAYTAFKKESKNEQDVTKLYENHRKDLSAVTPTYVPAIINNAFLIFKKNFSLDDREALKNSCLFMFQILNQLYSFPLDKRISCIEFAKDVHLLVLLEKWRSNHHAYDFELNEKFELKEREKSELALVNFKL